MKITLTMALLAIKEGWPVVKKAGPKVWAWNKKRRAEKKARKEAKREAKRLKRATEKAARKAGA